PITFTQLKFDGQSGFFEKLWSDAIWRPLSAPWCRSSFATDMQNYGQQFGWYHLVNIFLHLSSCIALYSLVFRLSWRFKNDGRSLLNPYRVALLSAAIYACHPLAVQATTYISARYAPLAVANFLLALNFFVAAIVAAGGN